MCCGRGVGVAVAVGPRAKPLRTAAPIKATPSKTRMAANTLIVMTRAARLADGGACGAGIIGSIGWRQQKVRPPVLTTCRAARSAASNDRQ